MAGTPTDERPRGFAMDAPAPARGGVASYLLDTLRHRPLGRHALTALTTLLFVGGAGMFTYPFFTDVYTNQVVQAREADEFAQIQVEVETFADWETTLAERGEGAALTKIVIPDIGVNTLVVSGTSPAALRAGAGHYRDTPLPGQLGNVAIAGHRTTYGRPFNRLDELPPGADVWLSTPVGDYRYVVTTDPDNPPDPNGAGAAFVVAPTNWEVVSPHDGALLTLTTCHPKGSAAQRLIVRAELAETFPAGHYDALVAAAPAA